MKIFLGERLKEMRKQKKLTQNEIAQVFNISSVCYLYYEKEKRQPSLELLVDFAKFFDVSVDYLLGVEDFL